MVGAPKFLSEVGGFSVEDSVQVVEGLTAGDKSH